MSTPLTEKDYESRSFNVHKLFNDFVTNAVRDFPKLKDNFVVYCAPTNSWYGDFEEGKKSLRFNAAKERLLKNTTSDYSKKNTAAFAFNKTWGDIYELPYNGIGWVSDFVLIRTTQQEILKILQHELGHLVVPAATRLEGCRDSFDQNFKECAAEAFAILRVHQINPLDNIDLQIDDSIWETTLGLLYSGDTDHFTLYALTQLQRLNKKYDLTKLTSIQTANLAYRIAKQNSLPWWNCLEKIKKIYAPIAEIEKQESGTISRPELIKKLLKKCTEIMFEDHGELSSIIYTVGKTALNPYLEEKLDPKSFTPEEIAARKLEGTFWNDIRRKIKEHDAKIAAQENISEKILSQKILDLKALGYFDLNQNEDKIIDPLQYDSSRDERENNMVSYLEHAKKLHGPGF